MTEPLNRRTALALLAAGVVPFRLQAAQKQLRALQTGVEPKLIFLDEAAHRLVDALCEAIIPTDDHSPGAHAARVSYYIDLVLGNSPVEAQEAWRAGMAALERLANKQLGKSFVDAGGGARTAFLNQLAGPSITATPERDFFARIKQMTISGYYTSEIGLLKELGYKGNQAIAEFPGCNTPPGET